jgi:ADP-ribose pyrophosphatase YjhB (NUDIX family)
MIREFTASVYIIENAKVLLIYHQKLKKWLPPGGHIEVNETPVEAARREVREEVGLEITFLSQENIWIEYWNASSFERPYLCLLEEIPAYQDKPAHQHMDLVYVAKPAATQLIASADAYNRLLSKWFGIKELELLRPDEEIFCETLDVIHHLLKTFKVHPEVVPLLL